MVQIADLIVLGTVIAFGVGISFAIVFQCNPVSKFLSFVLSSSLLTDLGGVWNKTIPSKCINIKLVLRLLIPRHSVGLGMSSDSLQVLSAKFVLTFNSALGYAAGGISVVQDVVILLLPIPELISLCMNLKRKLNVLFMFNIGVMYVIMLWLEKSRY